METSASDAVLKREGVEAAKECSSCNGTHAAQLKYMGTYVSRAPAAAPPFLKCSNFRLPPPDAHFLIPPLHSSFPSLLHPHYELVKQHCDGWILHVAQPPSAAASRLLLDCVLPRLVCRSIPTASSIPRLIHATKMVAWFIIADDDDDHPDLLGADDAGCAHYASRVMVILRCKDGDNMLAENQPALTENSYMGCSTHEFNCDSVDCGMPPNASSIKSERKEAALEALSELWAEMQSEMTPGLRDRFLSSIEHYLQAILKQATFRKKRHLPDMDAYLDIRREASFFLPCFALLEYALGIELEEDAYNNPLIEKFRNLVVDYMCLCNDLISCKVEIGVGDYFNMPSIAYNTSANKEWSFQDAIDYVASMISDLDVQCVSMTSIIQLSSSPSLQHEFVHTYIMALCSSMSGSLAWFLETARYRDCGYSSSVEK